MLGLKIFLTGALFTILLPIIIVASGVTNRRFQFLVVTSWYVSIIAAIVGIILAIWR